MRARSLANLLLVASACLVALPAHARLGEKAAELRQRFGKPEAQPQKNVLVWLIEESAGALLYTVTLDEKDTSIAEGLKPFRQAKMTEQSARNFIAEQLSSLPSDHKAHELKPGEAYAFAGEKLTCGPNERVVVDDANGMLIVWTVAPTPSVLAVTRAMFERTRR
ncbi:MAG: hypothetical protein HYV96_09685 [Opitutae bacterium]|nr:hypothetical protein [Opitutae bacterium]